MRKLRVNLAINRRNFREVWFDMLVFLKHPDEPFDIEQFSKQRDDFEKMLAACREYYLQETDTYWRRVYVDRMRTIDLWYSSRLEMLKKSIEAQAEKLDWELLPKGKLSFEHLNSMIKKAQFDRDINFDQSRLDYVKSLAPNKIYVGNREFNGYYVFLFSWTSKVLLENPFYGNAAYVFSDSWKRLSRLTKHELMAVHSDRVTKIIHKRYSEKWREHLRDALRSSEDGTL